MKKRKFFELLAVTGALVLGTVTFGAKQISSPQSSFNKENYANEGMVDENTYHESIYDEAGIEPIKMQLMDYNDYSQSPTDDSKYSTQKTYHLNLLNLGDTWNTYRGDGVTIAAIDTGINYSHEDFVYYGQTGTSISSLSACFEDPNGTGYATKKTVSQYGWDVMTDENGHGTNVASTIASRINGKGGVGVAPNVNLIFCKAPNLMSSEVSAAIRYAADNGADIITMSIGMYATSFTSPYTNKPVTYSTSAASLFSSAINYAHSKGCLILAAAGNDNTDYPSYPASNDYVIGIGALSKNSTTAKAAYSNFNKSSNTKNSNNNVDVTVCGSVYVATKATSVSYGETQGTSFSCPITAAALALYCQSHPDWTEATAKQALFDSCKDIGSSGWDTTYGYGCVSISDLVGISYDVSAINLSKTSLDLYNNNDSSDLTATVVPEYATNKTIDWTTSDSTVASISTTTSTSGNSITITGKKAGSATITAKSRQFPSISKTCSVTVSNYVSSSFTASIDDTTMYTGNTQQIKINWTNGTPTYNDLSYSSSNASVATVSETGMISALTAGSTTITIDSLDDSHTIELTVLTDKPATWKLIKSTDDLIPGDKYVFVGIKSNKASYYCNGSLESDYLDYVDITVQNETITTLPAAADQLTLGGSSGAWTFKLSSSDKFLNASTNSKFALSDSATTYTISIATTGIATIKGGGGSYTVYSNANSPRFRPYPTAQASVYLYHKSYDGEQPTPTNYAVSFESNGGSGSMASTTTNGSTYVVPECNFTKEGYTFDKWALNSATGNKYAVGTTISNISSNITLYAIWTEKPSSSDDFNGYYDSINEDSTTLLADLRSLNIEKRQNPISYGNLNQYFKYTDYDPNGATLNGDGQPYNDKLLSFYSGDVITSSSSYNKEHVWPNSRGGGSDKGRSGSPYVEDDLFMPRPTLTSENSDRGNSSFVEGMSHASNGWDPVTAFDKTYTSIRGECARIIFYCMTVNKNLRIVDDANTDFDGVGGRVTIGKLSDLLRWNLQNPVNDREIRRQSGGQYIQKNRNAFVDHPEYACKIWGNTSDATRQICSMDPVTNKELVDLSVSGTPSKTVYQKGENFSPNGLTVTATFDDGTSSNVTSSVVWTPSPLDVGVTEVTGTYTYLNETKTVTITGLTVNPWTVVDGDYTIEFKNSSADGSSELTTTTIMSDNYLKMNTLASGMQSVSKVYAGTYGLKLGASGSAGNFVINLVDGAKNGIKSIDIYSKKYGSDSGTIKFTLGSKTGSFTPTATGSKQTQTFNETISAQTLKIETSSKRGYVQKVVLHVEDSSTPKVTSVTLDPKTLSFDLYQSTATKTITATVLGDTGVDTSVVWTSSNEGVATVSGGVVTPVGVGQTTITATSTADSTKSDTCIVTVSDSTPKVTGLTLSPTSLTFDVYNNMNPQTIEATVTADTGADKTVTWTSSNEDVAIVNEEGVVTPHAKGSATITAKAGTITKTCSVTVNDSTPAAVSGVTLNKESTTLIIGSSETLIATVNPSNAGNKNITWSTSDSSIAIVSNGTVNAIAAGTATITVTTEEGGHTATCTVTVTAAPVITYQLEADQKTVPYMSGTNHQVSVGVKLYQYTNSVKGNLVSSGSANVDTSILGSQDISYTYQSVTHNTRVKVTNIGASGNVGISSEGSEKSETINASLLPATSTSYISFSNKSVTGGTGAVYAGQSAKDKYGNIQMRSNNSNSGIVQTTSGGKVTKIKITVGSNSTNTINIYGKNTAYSSASDLYDTTKQGTLIGSLTSTSTITLTSDNQFDYIGIRSNSGAIYISSIEVTCGSAGVSYPATPTDQARAWSDYFIKLTGGSTFDGPCKESTPEARRAALEKVWEEVYNEYYYMVNGSKDAFCDSSATGSISEAMQHYCYIVDTYGLDDFVIDGSGKAPARLSNKNFLITNVNSVTVVTAIIVMVGAMSVGAYFFYKKRKSDVE